MSKWPSPAWPTRGWSTRERGDSREGIVGRPSPPGTRSDQTNTRITFFRSLEELGVLDGWEALRTLEGRGEPGKSGSVEVRSASGYRTSWSTGRCRSEGNWRGGHMKIWSFNERHKDVCVLSLLWNVQIIWVDRRLTNSKADKGLPRKKGKS